MSTYPQAVEASIETVRLIQAANRLADENRRLRAMLKRLEWHDHWYCPICDEHQRSGHALGCPLAELLKEDE